MLITLNGRMKEGDSLIFFFSLIEGFGSLVSLLPKVGIPYLL